MGNHPNLHAGWLRLLASVRATQYLHGSATRGSDGGLVGGVQYREGAETVFAVRRRRIRSVHRWEHMDSESERRGCCTGCEGLACGAPGPSKLAGCRLEVSLMRHHFPDHRIAAVHRPIGAEGTFAGVEDLVSRRRIRFPDADDPRAAEVEEGLSAEGEADRASLVETLADLD